MTGLLKPSRYGIRSSSIRTLASRIKIHLHHSDPTESARQPEISKHTEKRPNPRLRRSAHIIIPQRRQIKRRGPGTAHDLQRRRIEDRINALRLLDTRRPSLSRRVQRNKPPLPKQRDVIKIQVLRDGTPDGGVEVEVITEVVIVAGEGAVELDGVVLLYVLEVEGGEIARGGEVEVLYHLECGVECVRGVVEGVGCGVLDGGEVDVFA